MAEFVEDQHPRIGGLLEDPFEAVLVAGPHEPAHQRLEGEEEHRVAGLDGPDAEGDGQVGLANPRAAVDNLTVAIEGGQIGALVGKPAAREAELRDAQAALEHLDGLEIGAEPLDEVALLEEIVGTIKALRENLDGDPARGRQVVKRLLQTPIEVGPDEASGWSFKFRASFLDAPLDLAAPDGTVPLRPTESGFSGTVRRGDSRPPNFPAVARLV